jgi:hypothetical protein
MFDIIFSDYSFMSQLLIICQDKNCISFQVFTYQDTDNLNDKFLVDWRKESSHLKIILCLKDGS